MRIERVRVEGFRLLEGVEIMLQAASTVVVGRNNSGKTSLTDVFACFTGESGPKFRLEDFSSGIRRKFLTARDKRAAGEPAETVLASLPVIAITITFRYDAAEELGPLSPFVIDLDPDSTTAIVMIAKILYEAHDGVHLPEGYNGLGTRNLIYLLLKLEAFHKEYRARATRPGVHLIFIEEPEAHLHPQMQEVFISQLSEAVRKLSEKYPGEPAWQAQFVVSTHSSHVANAAEFDAIRYFLSTPHQAGTYRKTKVKDFRQGMDTISPEDRNFLHQYMTLTKCDLYFADKAILIEGTTERILMPRICRKVDENLPDARELARQYVTTIEIGGGYADKFYPLLDFLELKSIIITDIDAVYLDETGARPRWKKCPAMAGTGTSNIGIRKWFGALEGAQIAPAALIARTAEEKTQNFRRLAYQIPEVEGGPCGRSFEDALILANLDRFDLGDGDKGQLAWEMAQDMPKADTALKFALQAEAWNVPRYITEGLVWLSTPPPPPAEPPPADAAPGPEAT